MYVGGHWFSDIVAGLILALIGYAVARYLLEPRLLAPLEAAITGNRHFMVITEFLVFAWILQVAVEFREVLWVKRVIQTLLG